MIWKMMSIYSFDGSRASEKKKGKTDMYSVVVTCFGFDEDDPFFEFDCNGNGFSKRGSVGFQQAT